jgi:glycosyltransferase involved in cell wall biosynthesis
MSESDLVLSIVIPAFNAEKYLEKTLLSVLMQECAFKFEIILVDDGSTDSTFEIASKILLRDSQHRIIRKSKNEGKGAAVSIGYKESLGRYIQILDADDYLTSKRKLQIQIDFLNANEKFVAVGHNTLTVRDEKYFDLISYEQRAREYTYEETLSFNFYLHTSSYMVRKIFKELPYYFSDEKAFRGDSAFLYFHVYHSKKGIYYLPDILSVYNMHGKGLWTSMNWQEKKTLTRELFTKLKTLVLSDDDVEEKSWLTEKIARLGEPSEKEELSKPTTSEVILRNLERVAGKVYDQSSFKKLAGSTNSFWEVDCLCSAIGAFQYIHNGFLEKNDLQVRNQDKIVILVSGFSPRGGGVYQQLLNLIGMLVRLEITPIVISTEMLNLDSETAKNAILNSGARVYLMNQMEYSRRIIETFEIISNESPRKVIAAISHHDVVANAVIGAPISSDSAIWMLYDHISTLGITSTSITTIISPLRSLQLALQDSRFHAKSHYIPTIFDSKVMKNPYSAREFPIYNTASASARSYKAENKGDIDFSDVLLKILETTSGIHFHFGPIGEEFMNSLTSGMSERNIPKSRFCNIEYVDDLQEAIIGLNVDAFVATPIPGTITSQIIRSCGVPLIVLQSLNKNSVLDTSEIYGKFALYCETLLELQTNITSLELSRRLELSRQIFSEFHEKYSIHAVTNAWQDFLLNDGGRFTSKQIESVSSVSGISDISSTSTFNELFNKI